MLCSHLLHTSYTQLVGLHSGRIYTLITQTDHSTVASEAFSGVCV